MRLAWESQANPADLWQLKILSVSFTALLKTHYMVFIFYILFVLGIKIKDYQSNCQFEN